MDEPVELLGIETELWVCRAMDGGVDVLRQFTASVRGHSDAGEHDLGQVDGWLGWSIGDDDVADAADAICQDSATLGATATAIVDANEERFIDSVVLIDRMYLKPEWRGRRLSRQIVDDLLALLRLDPDATVVVLQPEPQKPGGGPYESGPERERAMRQLKSAYSESGFESWAGSDVWWRPF